MSQAIRVFVTGGTFDKEYDELTGRLFFKDTHLPEMLRLARCRVDVRLRTLMMIDSLDMTDDDRRVVVESCRGCEEDRIEGGIRPKKLPTPTDGSSTRPPPL